ncbi:hypothetical protein SAMN04488033_11962 [Salegentibacter agarivorans]|uniref:Natural product n=1 Tax=Salegentibacter agarivorans TaxID=345907 RepID=A0A1I2NBH7_9FLAO|nr:hypothetical protein [Salegentibacter agarivorans]SFG00209.1 hypothetical protein SAMN04488033_11962 [Salegentibacter agarivorans]
MKKLSLQKLKLGADDLLQREQLKSVFGGYGGYQGGSGDGLCSCKAGGNITYETYVGQCDYCETVCHYSSPSSTSWICSGAW